MPAPKTLALAGALLSIGLFTSPALVAQSAEVNGWRGPQRDGTPANFTAPASWPKVLVKKWQLEVGVGHSSPVVIDDRIYQFSRQDDKEVLRCIGLNGEVIWQQSNDAPYEMHNAARGHGKGPKSTPWVDERHVYTLGIDGIFQCRSAEDGKLLWQAASSLPQGSPLYGAATSPLVVDDVCLVHLGKHDTGALVAFDVGSGKPLWVWRDDGPAYTSPVVMDFDGQKQIVTQSQQLCMSLSPDGKLLWKLPFKTGYDQNSVTPLQYKDLAIISGFRKGATALRPQLKDGQWQAEEVWHDSDVSMYMSSPVVVGERLYGFSQVNKGQLFCLNANTGETIWLGPPRQGDNAALWVAGKSIVAQVTDGRLLIIDAEGDSYRTRAEYNVSDSPVWAHPALVKDAVLIKNEDSLTLWSLK